MKVVACPLESVSLITRSRLSYSVSALRPRLSMISTRRETPSYRNWVTCPRASVILRRFPNASYANRVC